MKHVKKQKRRMRAGFTLLEVLLVLAILGVIAAMVVPNLLGRQREAYIQQAAVSVKNFENTVKMYAIDHDGEYPTGDAETVFVLLLSDVDERTGEKRQPYLDAIPLDPWKNPLMYEYPASGNRQTMGDKPAIWSMGPDKQEGTDDDVTNWEVEGL